MMNMIQQIGANLPTVVTSRPKAAVEREQAQNPQDGLVHAPPLDSGAIYGKFTFPSPQQAVQLMHDLQEQNEYLGTVARNLARMPDVAGGPYKTEPDPQVVGTLLTDIYIIR